MLRHGLGRPRGDCWCAIENGEAILMGREHPRAPRGRRFGHEAKRPRKLLLHKAWRSSRSRPALARDGMTAAATRLYFKDGRVKVEIALAPRQEDGRQARGR